MHLSGILPGTILGPIFFSILINDLFFFVKYVYFSNFPDDNTVYTARNSTEELIKVLKTESNFKMNHMIVNPDTFQAMTLSSKMLSSNYFIYRCCFTFRYQNRQPVKF